MARARVPWRLGRRRLTMILLTTSGRYGEDYERLIICTASCPSLKVQAIRGEGG
jgi:hypothetical protein